MNEVQALLIELLEGMSYLDENEIEEIRRNWILKMEKEGNYSCIGLANAVCDMSKKYRKKVA